MLQIKTDLYRYVHYTSNVAVCNYQELIGCDVSFMVVLISERHGGLFYNNENYPFSYIGTRKLSPVILTELGSRQIRFFFWFLL